MNKTSFKNKDYCGLKSLRLIKFLLIAGILQDKMIFTIPKINGFVMS